ncbi:tRNA pseudouridine(55) synthase [Cladophialophora bantiana CBS 173.52]|uniref:tRNA pseudouridine(55) synthase n=1 Tax=Cladophialophora bantiana (strain ATCC 10958 / CBS 173.52 / CDC B-1940 / NIH 8579) TaxID=1442370 RepID=A0A0D2F7J1_CLAB1|nr:tRNA pseudouridine(55) synthase [Cladophialophora bantiana CBS 173.52]KIW98036.1 tRNA pseudouridine(55) synthase [Cladophialophora bantiana CBS 173.52]
MAQPSGKILEGVFAISKPPSISSAQVLRDLQHKFADSKTFAPLLDRTRKAQEDQERHQPKRRKKSNDQIFKMGHGGTLDPLATGVLIVGIGRGSKSLSDFLACKKTYETVVLFGKSTDTYDVMGKVVADASTEGITQKLVEDRLAQFRGKMKQIPPIYSAIKIDGMKLYEYARSGRELPRELESRDIEISDCTLLEFYGPGEHDFRWPAEQASDEEKAVARKLMPGSETTKKFMGQEAAATSPKSPLHERFREQRESNHLPPAKKAELHTHYLPTQEAQAANAPAARIRLTVSSGFYVRSFAHDLGVACGSYGTMAALVRSKQGDYTNIDPTPQGLVPALTYDDLEAGEDIWGPKIADVLNKWMNSHPADSNENRADNRDRPDRDHRHKRFKRSEWRESGSKRTWTSQRSWEDSNRSRRRNSSSPDT